MTSCWFIERELDNCISLNCAEHSLCTAPWSGTPCRTTSAHSRTMSPLDTAWKRGFSLDTNVFSALEIFVIIALYKSTFTIPYHYRCPAARSRTTGTNRLGPETIARCETSERRVRWIARPVTDGSARSDVWPLREQSALVSVFHDEILQRRRARGFRFTRRRRQMGGPVPAARNEETEKAGRGVFCRVCRRCYFARNKSKFKLTIKHSREHIPPPVSLTGARTLTWTLTSQNLTNAAILWSINCLTQIHLKLISLY